MIPISKEPTKKIQEMDETTRTLPHGSARPSTKPRIQESARDQGKTERSAVDPTKVAVVGGGGEEELGG